MNNLRDHQTFTNLFATTPKEELETPSSLKARLYSSFIREQQTSGPLASLSETVASGREICVFEKLVQISPIGEAAKSPFFCHVCHARVLGENFERPSIFWPHCPYVAFKR